MRVGALRRVAGTAVGVLAAATVLVGAGAAASAVAAPAQAAAVPGVPAQVQDGRAVRVGDLPGSQLLRLTLGVAPPHAEQETQFLAALQTKGSPQFQHYLTPEAYTARFGPSVQSEAAVVGWAGSHGLTVTQRFPDRLLVDVEGSATAIEAALSVRLQTYRVGAETDFSNDRPPTIPAALQGILANVEGLNNIQHYRPLVSAGASGPGAVYAPGPARTSGASLQHDAAPAATPSVTHGGTDPNDLDSSQGYDYGALYRQGHCCNPTGNANNSPPQSSIDLVGFGTVDYSDVNAFAGEFGLATSISGYNIDGTPPTTNDDDNLEDTLDLEYATATANSFGAHQNTSHITEYYVANFNSSTFTDAYNFMYTDGDARTMSASYGGAENDSISGADMDTNHNVFNSMVGTGWTLFASSGDHGSYANCSSLSVSYPSTDPDVIAVGGTSLALSAGSFSSETAWSPSSSNPCDNNTGGSGGGCSVHFSTPSWQSPLNPCGGGSRAVPDISLNSATQTPQHLYYKGSSYYTVWGTSIASPEMAGFNAQEDAYLLSIGDGPAGAWATHLWYEGQHPTYAPHDPLYDITSGCNYWSGQSGYCAHSGYDVVTGWGSADMLQLAWMLNWEETSDVGRPTVSFSGPTRGQWYATDQDVTWSVADTGGGQPATGVAGFTQGWDSLPGDPTSEAHQGSGNSFYDGPQFPNATSGFLGLAGAGYGCHIAYVAAWDNMGLQSGNQAYGQLCYDPTTPAGSVAVDGGRAATNSRTATLSLSASDPVASDPIQHMRFATDNGAYGAWQAYASSATLMLPAGEGVKHVHVEYQNAAGTVSAPANAAITLDMTAPSIGTVPTVSISLQPVTSGTTSHLKVAWAGSDGAHGSGVASYTLQESVDGGSYGSLQLQDSAATSALVAAPAGHTYQFRVLATDTAGNSSAYRAGRLDTLKFIQESGPAVTYAGAWSRVSVPGTIGGKVDESTHHGAAATLKLTGFAVALVTDIARGHGTATVALDGGRTSSVNTAGGALRAGQVVYSTSFAAGNHTFVVTNTGSGSASRVDLDGFFVLS